VKVGDVVKFCEYIGIVLSDVNSWNDVLIAWSNGQRQWIEASQLTVL
jgi:hypothetical protein